MCLALGQPLMLDAADHSCTQRPRAYWTHMRLHPAIEPVTQGFDPMNPNQYNVMLPGHTAELYVVDVKTAACTIGASWIGEPERPCADTSVPVLVHNMRFEQPQSIIVDESEMLLGYPASATAGRGATPIDHL